MRRVALLVFVVVVLAALAWSRWPSRIGGEASEVIADGARAAAAPGLRPSASPGSALESPPAAASILPGGGSPNGLSILGRYTADETRLFAEVERVTRRPMPAGLQRLIDRRREGADREELEALAKELGREDVLLRATALQWVDRMKPAVDVH